MAKEGWPRPRVFNRKVLADDPVNPEALHLLGVLALMALALLQDAVRSYEKALGLEGWIATSAEEYHAIVVDVENNHHEQLCPFDEGFVVFSRAFTIFRIRANFTVTIVLKAAG